MVTFSVMSLQRSEEPSEEEEEEGLALREELRFETLEEGEGSGLQLSYRHGYRRGCLLLSVGGVIIFTAGKCTHVHTHVH